MAKEITITLTTKEVKLLKSMLTELEDNRSSMGCNDPYDKEEKLFTKLERKGMLDFLAKKNYLSKEDAEDMEGFMYNNFYVAYMLHKIKEKEKESKKEKA